MVWEGPGRAWHLPDSKEGRDGQPSRLPDNGDSRARPSDTPVSWDAAVGVVTRWMQQAVVRQRRSSTR